MESIHCTVMLEDQSEERACLFVLGLLEDAEARAFEAEMRADEVLRRTVTDFEETLANLLLATTPNHPAPDPVLRRLLDRIDGEPARVTTDAEGLIETINPAFTRLCGYRIEELRGRRPGSILQGPATDPAPVVRLRTAIRAGLPCEVDLVNYHKDGHLYGVHVSLEPVRDAKDALTGFCAVAREIPLPAA